MPWHVEKGGGTCGSSEWAVIKDADGSTAGCHDTEAEAHAQMAALYANEGDKMSENAADCGCEQRHEERAVDNTAWDGPAAMSNCASKDSPGSCYRSICAGRKDGDADLQSSWALPHHKTPGAPPNAAGVRNSLSRLPQTQGLTNREEAQRHLEAHLASIQAQSNAANITELRQQAAEARKAAFADSGFATHSEYRASHPILAVDSPMSMLRGQQRADGRTVQDRYLGFPAQIRAHLVERDGKNFYRVDGYATVFDYPYEMWDVFGPYEEDVARGAADETLAAKPDVVFLVNHRGLSLARTGGPWNGNSSTLELSADSQGLHDLAWLNPERSEVKDLMLAIDDKQITEQSFGFMIDEGSWNEEFTRYTIKKFNIHRGDVSAVNYGANPGTSIAARQQEILTELRLAPPAVARAAILTLQQRGDLDVNEWLRRFDELRRIEQQEISAEAAKGRSLAHIEALLEI